MRKIDIPCVKCQNTFSVASIVNDVATDKSGIMCQCRFSAYLTLSCYYMSTDEFCASLKGWNLLLPYRLGNFSSLALSLHFCWCTQCSLPSMWLYWEDIFSLYSIRKLNRNYSEVLPLPAPLCVSCYKLSAVTCLVLWGFYWQPEFIHPPQKGFIVHPLTFGHNLPGC